MWPSQPQAPWSRRALALASRTKSLGITLLSTWFQKGEEITVSQLQKGVLGIGVRDDVKPPKKSRKKTPVVRPTDVHFTVLADPTPRRRAFAASFMIQCLGVAFLLALPLLLPERLDPFRRFEVVPLVAPPTTLPLAPPKIIAKTHPPEEKLEKPKIAKLMAPPKRVFEAMKLDAPQPAHPRAAVRTGALAAVNFAGEPTVHREAHQVQTGGFGDPNGLPGKGDPKKRANIAQRGSFDLPNGAGFGNGLGGANGVPGRVAGGGGAAVPAVEPVELLSKPRPVYTEEARRLRLEGDVTLQVIFRANGQVQVVRVVRGLGHGLDEAAIRAAQQIQFKPARRHGAPVDFPAVIHIVFQMAY